MTRVTSRYAALSREELAVLVPELLLIGQLIDRSGMAWCISAFGREEMAQIAIEEWAASSPVYTRRMQKALGYEGTDIYTIFKGLQLDIGAPPQFMDFRYTVHDRWHGEFHLDHCGALMDVEPMGPEYVRSMCHDIEDPTFDATAVATNPKAQVRPIHRPPRLPADRSPHCAWTVIIDESHPPVSGIPALAVVQASRAATFELDPIDPGDDGLADYSGPLLADLDFGAFSHSALVRIADEVCLQMHLLNLGFLIALRARTGRGRRRSSGPSRPSSWSASPAWLRVVSTGRWGRRTVSRVRCGCSGCTRCSIRWRTPARRWATPVSPWCRHRRARTAAGSPSAGLTRRARCRRSSRRSTPTSTSRSRAWPTTGARRGAPRVAGRPSWRRSRSPASAPA